MPKSGKVIRIRKQTINSNNHNPTAVNQLRKSVDRDGWIGAITVARDGETFDGSARVDVAGSKLQDAVIVESDGSRPVVVVRKDIPNASHPKAVRLGVAANQIQAFDYNPDLTYLNQLRESDPEIKKLLDADAEMLKRLNALNAVDGNPDDGHKDDNPSDAKEYRIIVTCANEQHQHELLERFEGEGIECRALIS